MHVARRQNHFAEVLREMIPQLTSRALSLSLTCDRFICEQKGRQEKRVDESNLTRCVLCDDRSSFWFRQLMTVGPSIRSAGTRVCFIENNYRKLVVESCSTEAKSGQINGV